ncbi:MAG: Rrf2 family transcriptional regulator [Ruminococcus sp.]|nr:Rrf2 family transcriptional regulator [Ruminococcus sp.]
MKISTKVECGILAITDIAINARNGKTVTVISISGRQGISEKYLEQILSSLRHSHLIKGQKGSGGGYILSKRAEDITLNEVINALESSLLNNDVPEIGNENNGFSDVINELLWNKIERYMSDCAMSVTVADLAERYEKELENNASEPMYYI